MSDLNGRGFCWIAGIALLFWVGAVQLSDVLAGRPPQGEPNKSDTGNENPTAVALERFLNTLQRDPENEEALLGIARLSFEAGVLDKASTYYRRYLDLQPDDIRAQTDYALVLIQSERAAEAVEILEAVVGENPKLFPSRLSLALGYKVLGETERARETAEAAREIAPNAEALEVIARFLSDLKDNPTPIKPPTTSEDPKTRSPAMVVNSYFRNHEIVGPKLQSITWKDGSTVEVALKEFPVEAMPPFARDRFLSGIRNALRELPEKVHIRLVDSVSGKELLAVSGGGE